MRLLQLTHHGLHPQTGAREYLSAPALYWNPSADKVVYFIRHLNDAS